MPADLKAHGFAKDDAVSDEICPPVERVNK